MTGRTGGAPGGTQQPLVAAGTAPRAWLFDLDGVLTDSAAIHVRAWKETFDRFLSGAGLGLPAGRPFDEVEDYERYVDGKPRRAGVRDFLASRGVVLPEDGAGDGAGDGAEDGAGDGAGDGAEDGIEAAGAAGPGPATVAGLADAKNRRYLELLAAEGVRVFPGSLALLDAVRAAGRRTAVVSASENTTAVLVAAGIAGRFDAQVDGIVARQQGLRGKPAADTYLFAAAQVGCAPGDAAVVEDAPAGVAAGAAGHFGLVVGVARRATPADLLASGAHLVVGDLAELLDPVGPGNAGRDRPG